MNKLDQAYDEYWRSPRSRPDTGPLLRAVHTEAIHMAHDDDIAQEVSLRVHVQLDRFSRSDDTAFSRWVRSIIRRTKLELYRGSSDHTREHDDNAIATDVDESYVDTSKLPSDIRQIAHMMLEGHSLTQIADQLNVTSAALRNKLSRYRKRALRNAA